MKSDEMPEKLSRVECRRSDRAGGGCEGDQKTRNRSGSKEHSDLWHYLPRQWQLSGRRKRCEIAAADDDGEVTRRR